MLQCVFIQRQSHQQTHFKLLVHTLFSIYSIFATQDALQELNIQYMPPEKEATQVKKVRQDLGTYLT